MLVEHDTDGVLKHVLLTHVSVVHKFPSSHPAAAMVFATVMQPLVALHDANRQRSFVVHDAEMSV